MVMSIDEKLELLTVDERQEIYDAVMKTYGKMLPDGTSLEILYNYFKTIVEPNFNARCGKCRKRVTAYWYQRLKSWKML